MSDEIEPENAAAADEEAREGEEGVLGKALTFAEGRVLGCLLEKEATTPAYYPMTLNSLQAACNQKSSRDPVSELEEDVIERALEGLRVEQLAVKVHLSGSRSPKYKHTLDRRLNLEPGPQALLCVLLLRGPQTAGELNQRTERLHEFGSVEAVESALHAMMEDPGGALVAEIPAGGGRRVKTYQHLLCGKATGPVAGGLGGPVSAAEIVLEEEASWRQNLEGEVASLRSEVTDLRERLDALERELR